VAELADAQDSKSCPGNRVWVQVPPSAFFLSKMQNKFKIHWSATGKAFLICSAFTALYLLIATSSTLWDRDEPRFSRAAVEMTESGNYLVPTFNGKLRPDKPILIYWLMSIPIRLLGPTEFACRFCQCIGSGITLLLTFYIGSNLFNAKTGLWAQAILATTILMIMAGSSAIVEGVLLPLIVGAIAIFVRRGDSKLSLADIIAIGILMGLGMLAKGPLGLMPLPVIFIILWFNRKDFGSFVRSILPIAFAAIIAGLIFIAWIIPVDKATNGEFSRQFFGHHILQRAARPLEGHGGKFFLNLFYYPAIIIGFFFPWTVFLPGAFSATLGKRIADARTRNILLSWIIVPVLLMTLAATKLPHYILFAWPAMAVMTGAVIAASGQNVLNKTDRKWLRGGIWFMGPVGLGIAGGLTGIGYFIKIEGLILPGLICGIIMAAMIFFCCNLQVLEKFIASAKVILIGVLSVIVPVLFLLLPAIESVKISPYIAKAVREKTGKDVPVAMYKYTEPTLNFYIGRNITQFGKDNDAINWMKESGEHVLIIPRENLDSIRQNAGDTFFKEIASKKGVNYSKGREVEVVALLVKTQNRP
jgi:4-amino-4-deoxy-L-arabinose transferase-like glycosyltransferase